MLRMDGSTDEGRAYGPFPVAPARSVQSASARLHPRPIGMGGASLRARGRVGIRFGDVGVVVVALTWWTARAVGAVAAFGVKRTSATHALMTACDPKRTSVGR